MTRLTKDDLKNRSRYHFETKDVELPEFATDPKDIPTVAVKTLSVAERDELPTLTEAMLDNEGKPVLDAEGNPMQKLVGTIDDFAQFWSTIVSDPKMTVAETKEFFGDIPATALDKVMSRFGELVGTQEDADTKFREFPRADEQAPPNPGTSEGAE